ncbi:PDR/VanB family oxidoreductase [Streptomyces beihaiensis]|uniref:PDR/VanB family oxidoreductase n=1 Tax=Streptomyces beihaiensis TaxID=2984495 RepID=A0ABT3TQX3_9ACTN|nr:PDR/VanB family oxidoreductase [Streptomyces beihaiensis]MCX3059444.1 PDR/VanB family oxidoreductase [Streptomyces beihaiensis]
MTSTPALPTSPTAAAAPSSLVLRSKESLTPDIVRLTLTRPDGDPAPLPDWRPGAHVDLHLADGLIRPYSLCSDPADRRRWQVAVAREADGGRGGSAYVHDELEPGDVVAVHGPRNHFPLDPAPRYLFLAGGIGITPLLSMLAEAERSGADWQLVYGGRSLAAMAFRAELLAVYGDARVRLVPQDTQGLPDLDALLGTPRPDTLVYCCGPEGLLRAAERRCASWPRGTLRTERFTPPAPGPPLADAAFEVELARTGTTLTVPPGSSVLETVEQAGVDVLFSCREGTCGTCETAVLDGTVDHRDALLTPDERAAHDTMLICVSRAAAACHRLVLDL